MMNRAIPLALLLALTACERTTDSDTPNVTTTTPSTAGSETPEKPSGDIQASVFQFGTYKATRQGKVKESSETNTGKVVLKPVLEHVSMTDRVPLVKETYFGFQYRLWNLPPEAMIKPVLKLRSVLIHPEMTLPDGSKTSGWDDRVVKGRVETQQIMGFDGYALNEDYELVEGDWIFQIWYQDKMLIERKFYTVQPQPEKPAESAAKE